MKLIVFSICKNEAKTIGKVLDLVPETIPGIHTIEKWVLSDGSTDGTVDVAERHGAKVIDGRYQKRLAYRFQEAVDIALHAKADVMVNIDGDLQFDPRDIPRLIEPILKDGYDFVAADRFTDSETGKKRRPENMPASKYWANRLGARVVSILTKEKFNDVTCGFRAYNRRALLGINLNGKYTYTQESFQVLAMKRMNIATIPLGVKYYPDRKSRVVTNFTQFLFGSGLNILRAYRDFAPLRFFGLLSFVSALAGIILLTFLGVHWLQEGKLTPYKSVGFIGIYFVTVGLFMLGLGLVADMLQRLNNNQEKILEKVKTIELMTSEENE
ncbi:MAG: glycosyltransferase [Candidatus Saccharimonadales bacterium]